ncbi:P-loop containing nucleoside triphosphate hydrolase protein [Conidiobolus coronatus NRRL 28638]|uniref:Kinesin-like protein n=1 Tax=Conidiobolus coronatus (strain ATCC 28846 / CBS 209.66 / NRRL 28638) TaxID=796925 RepID=A0A137PDS3_CONC2|nr:P-loop containing nucleoside triphosphate hydrolase protein [Conidiobolus coronatus NRRL 28638]|eukprot:KXN73149.1 P-loop containing nucleoside triphosphate hydrolase protein [Conidiobolus coronatus NRRL 28638]
MIEVSLSNKAFRNIHGIIDKKDNKTTFTTCVVPMLSNVINGGGTGCCFSYGNTSSGKTHTILGYGDELGLYLQAGAKMLELIKGQNLLLQIRFAEVYNDQVFDLLDERKICSIREDYHSEFHIRGEIQKDSQGRVKVNPMKSINVNSIEDLIKVVHQGIRKRAVGCSNVHNQSSRSHAILELEIVDEDLISLRENVLDKEADVVPRGKARDDFKIEYDMKCTTFDKTLGKYVYIGNEQVTEEDREKLRKLEQDFTNVEKELEKARLIVRQKIASQACLGGTFVFIDLAGSEHGKDNIKQQSKKERLEASQINKSLLALKECIRALNRKSSHAPFRDSVLTKYLRKHLVTLNSKSVMITNISPSRFHEKQTVNTLRYAELVASLS